MKVWNRGWSSKQCVDASVRDYSRWHGAAADHRSWDVGGEEWVSPVQQHMVHSNTDHTGHHCVALILWSPSSAQWSVTQCADTGQGQTHAQGGHMPPPSSPTFITKHNQPSELTATHLSPSHTFTYIVHSSLRYNYFYSLIFIELIPQTTCIPTHDDVIIQNVYILREVSPQ